MAAAHEHHLHAPAAKSGDRSRLQHDSRSERQHRTATPIAARPITSAPAAAAPSSPPTPEKYLDPSQREPAGADAGRHHLHLPDASGGAPGGPGLLPDLRHGAGTGDAERRRRAQCRTDRHDAAALDRARAHCAGRRAGDGRPPDRLASAVATDLELGAACLRHTGRALGRLAVLRPRLAVARHP